VPSHLIFITLFLGIVSGKQGIELQGDTNIASIRLVLAGQEIARLTQPPWRTEIDLGSNLVPRELEAIGYDAKGNEVGRASQVLNLPKPAAEVQIVLGEDGVQLRWTNLEYAKPKSASVTFDGAPLRVDSDFRAPLPVYMDRKRPHVIDAEMRFVDGVVARREEVLVGTRFSDTAETQLTPVLLTETSVQHPASYDGCFSIDGAPVRVAVLEKEKARVIFVQDPDPQQTAHALDPTGRASNPFTRKEVARWLHFDDDTVEEILWPVVQRFSDPSGRTVSRLFAHSRDFESGRGVMALLTASMRAGIDLPRQYADAVAVAGIQALDGGRRRAVVLIVSDRADASKADPRTVQRYLASVGVPLLVWSPADVTPGATSSWGAVEDISTLDHLHAAVNRLRSTLAAQRIAWIHTDAFSALRIKADERCGFATVAH
jgi:hypothetical protein